MNIPHQYWVPVLSKSGKPAYLAIADAIADDVASGRLQSNDPLPPQRWLALNLGLNFSTISRAYAEAQRRGLIVSKVGQGTVVRGPSPKPPQTKPQSPTLVDMTMNLPPEPTDLNLIGRMHAGLSHVNSQFGMQDLMRYQSFGGSREDRQAAVTWLADRLPDLTADQVLVCPGTQTTLLAVLTTLAQAGDTVLCEDLTFSGFRSLAAHMNIRLVGIPMDRDGIDPDAFAKACTEHRPKALYLNPTLQNPTTITVPEDRRQRLIAIARQHNMAIIEDDAYGALPLTAPPPFAALAPDLTFYIAGLAKCLGAGLRIAFLVPPTALHQAKTLSALRATSVMPSPLTAALATRWITDGTANAVRDFIRQETQQRQQIVAALLPKGTYDTQPLAFHLWLKLPPPWTRIELLSHLRTLGLGVVTSESFAVTTPAPEAARLCIGGPLDQDQLRNALTILAQTISQSPSMTSAII